MFKHSLIVITAAALLYIASPRAVAQQAGSSDQQPATSEHAHAHQMDPAKRAATLAKQLNLNSDQQAKVEDVLKSEKSQLEGLHSDTSLSKEDRRSKMMDIHKSSSDQIRGLLDPDQQKKWDEMQSKQQERMQEHHHEQAPGGNSSSPQ